MANLIEKFERKWEDATRSTVCTNTNSYGMKPPRLVGHAKPNEWNIDSGVFYCLSPLTHTICKFSRAYLVGAAAMTVRACARPVLKSRFAPLNSMPSIAPNRGCISNISRAADVTVRACERPAQASHSDPLRGMQLPVFRDLENIRERCRRCNGAPPTIRRRQDLEGEKQWRDRLPNSTIS